jgi:signal transduction histidine kinase
MREPDDVAGLQASGICAADIPHSALIAFLLLGILLLSCEVGVSAERADSPGVACVTDFRMAVANRSTGIRDVDCRATVCSVSRGGRELVVADASGAELLLLEQAVAVTPGMSVRIFGTNCHLVRGDWGIVLMRSPMIDDDGLHGLRTNSATHFLPVGRHPLRLEWFNGGQSRGLELLWQRSGRPSSRIPDELFIRSDGKSVAAGLNYRCFEGRWLLLPNFRNMLPVCVGTISNVTLSPATRRENVGLEFTGDLMVPEAGEYTFHLASDDGARLFLGDMMPMILGGQVQAAPVPKEIAADTMSLAGADPAWVQVEGVVRHASEREECLELELDVGRERLRVGIVDRSGLQRTLLLNSRVQIRGVGRTGFRSDGSRGFALLAVASLQDVHLLELAPELRAKLPRTPIGSLTNSGGRTDSEVIRLVGKFTPNANGSGEILCDESGQIAVDLGPGCGAVATNDIEAFGNLYESGGRWRLACAFMEPGGNGVLHSTTNRLLTSVVQIHGLTENEITNSPLARIRGVIICDAPELHYGSVIRDEARGLFFYHPTREVVGVGRPRLGEYWEVEGSVESGKFAPVIRATQIKRLGEGQLPAPLQPAWDELVSGALDTQWVDLTGIVTDVRTNAVFLLTHGGKLWVEISDMSEPRLRQWQNRLVKLRGCLLSCWDEQTRQLVVGRVRLGNPTIEAIRLDYGDAFDAPAKQIGDLLRFDLEAGSFQRVRIKGQVVAERGGEYLLMAADAGARFVPRDPIALRAGDCVEIVGIPELGGGVPVLREAVVRKTGTDLLPEPTIIPTETIPSPEQEAKRVQLGATFVGLRTVGAHAQLDLRTGHQTFTARVPTDQNSELKFTPGSVLELTGVSFFSDRGASLGAFELLLNSASDVRVVSRPPWWNFRRLMYAMTGLGLVLVLAAIWITQLRRKVEERTRQLEVEVREREAAEQRRVLAEERARIARDLHDDLGTSLTEVSMLANVARRTGLSPHDAAQQLGVIADRASVMVSNLDVIVWAVDPEKNQLQAMVDYVAGYAGEFLMRSGIEGRFEIPIELPPVEIEGRARHELFLCVKEALNNIARHARATVVEFAVAATSESLTFTIADNGQGFDSARADGGHGLGNFQARLLSLGGKCLVQSKPGAGTRIEFVLPIRK